MRWLRVGGGGVFVQPRKQKRINNTIDPFPLYRIETNSFYENEDWFFLKKVGHSRPLLFIFCLSDTVDSNQENKGSI